VTAQQLESHLNAHAAEGWRLCGQPVPVPVQTGSPLRMEGAAVELRMLVVMSREEMPAPAPKAPVVKLGVQR
jgi:hypothetical protein